MKHNMYNKLKSKRGSGIAEALVGFLISVLSVLILFGVVSTTTDLIHEGDKALQIFYAEEAKMDQYNVLGKAGFLNSSAVYSGTGKMYIEHEVNGVPKPYTVSISGDPTGTGVPTTSSAVEGAYFETSKYHLFGFSAD